MPTCLRCQHFRPPPIDGDENPFPFEIADKIKKTREYIGGQCTLNPEWIKVREDHFCGQHRPHHGSSIEYNQSTIRNDLYGGDWRNKRIADLEEDNAKLRSSLKKTRKRSSDRLVRLKANGSAHKRVRSPGVDPVVED